MNIDLSKEGKRVDKALFKIEKEYEPYFISIFSYKKDNVFFVENERDANFYYYYPFLFYDEFEDVPIESFRIIALSGVLYFHYILLNDKLMDAKQLVDPSIITYSSYLLSKSFNLLYSLFSPSSEFWSYFAKYNQEFTNAVLLERSKHVGIISDYSQSEFELIARGKAAISKCATAALAVLCNSPKKIEPLEVSQDCFYIAGQLYDDFKDWKQDYKGRCFSHLLTNVIYEHHLAEAVESNNPPDLETIGRAIYLSKAAENQLKNAILFMEKSSSYGSSCHHWIEYIHKSKSIIQNSKKYVSEMRKKLLLRRERQQHQPRKTVHETETLPLYKRLKFNIYRSLDYLLTQQELDFPELKHRMSFYKSGGFMGEQEHHIGNVFQRALIVDTLLDARSFFPNADVIIKKEVEKLVSAKLRRVRGGWNYFPSLPELPPDADTLGQILQILIRSKYEKIDEEVSDPISLLLSQCSYDDGSFETWIVDNNDVSMDTAIIKSAIERLWKMRRGKDNAVVANILYGLYLYNFLHLKDRIEKGVNLLENRQSEEGYWSSTWYWGNYYGTYVSVRIIKEIKPDSPALSKAEDFLISSQNYDGGWGELGSDPLSTALTLLSLSLLESKKQKCYLNGISYLFSTQNKRGYWDRVEFIKMDTGKTIIYYKSKTISTQFCLKALLSLNNMSSLREITIPQQITFKRAEPKVYSIYNDFGNFLEEAEGKEKGKKRNLLNNLYINPNKRVLEELFKASSLDQKTIVNRLISYNKDGYESLIEKVKKHNIKNLCKESIIRCFEILPLNKIPSVYLWIGPSIFSGGWMFLDNEPAIIISLEFWANIQSSQTTYRSYFQNRCDGLKSSIALTIANQYCHIVLHQAGILRESLLDKLYEKGLASYFSRMVFPDYPLSSHIFFNSTELEWCQRNEWFLKREIMHYLHSQDTDIVNRYLSFNDNKKDKWFPDRVGYFVGYRIIEEYLKKECTLTIRDLINESPQEVDLKSGYFNV